MSATPDSIGQQIQSERSGRWDQTQRIALVIQYVGTHFHGWQRQLNQRTVQGDIEQVLREVLGYQVTLHGAGRTDAGVHAAAQVAHFDAPQVIPAARWAAILNHRLPADITVRASAQVDGDWHAQFSAQWRRYRYTLYTDSRPNLFISPYAWHYYYQPLDAALIQSALSPLVGKHDLTAFHRAGSGRAHSWVEVQAAECYRRNSLLYVELQASGFLYGMVRLIVGLIVQVGQGQRSPESFTQLWMTKRRDLVKYSAPAQGLCLLRVGYPKFPFAPEVWFDTQPLLSLTSVPTAV
ncbi:MAG: tRNA pseudouridine(38-40) synthase TruA [Leptolyngbya sp. SIO4C5]|nr:tRNA pseudouridine(38-40) synthase TruA [Leptolyngbya sp. SIO4C5]